MKKFSAVTKAFGTALLAACLFNSPAQATTPNIPDDAVEWNGHCYKIFNENVTWQQAKQKCEQLGGHLVTITDSSEQSMVESLLQNYSGRYFGFWLGAEKKSRSFQWVTGENFAYTNFAPGQPDGSGNYLQVYGKPPAEYAYFYVLGLWDDTPTDGTNSGPLIEHAFICEWDSPKRIAPPSSNQPAHNRVTVKGTGANRDGAIRDAARNAVENVIGVYIDARALSRDSELLLDEVYTKSQGYVKNITVRDENYSGGVCNVTADVEVDTNPDGQLMDRLSMIMMLNDPRISVIVLKENTSPPDHDNISETAMNERLMDLGFSHVVDANIVSNLQNAELLNNIYNGKSSLSGVGDSYGADYLVLGKSNVDVVPSSGASMGKADLSVKIIKFDTGDIIGTFTVEGQGAEKVASQAERKALKSASQEAAKKLEEKFKKLSAAPVQGLQVTVTAPNYDKVERLVEDIKSLNGVQNVRVREYRNGRAILDVDSSQNPNALLQLLKGHTDLKFSVEEISSAGMKIVIS